MPTNPIPTIAMRPTRSRKAAGKGLVLSFFLAAFGWASPGVGSDEASVLQVFGDLGARWKLNERGQVRTMDLSKSKVSAAELWRLPTLVTIEELQLAETAINDDGLFPLRKLQFLKILNLADTKITNVGIWNLIYLHKLEELDLSGTQIDDQAFVAVRRLENLKNLNVSRTAVSSYGILQLRDLKRLEVLNLAKTQVDDVAAVGLDRLPRLKKLILSETFVTEQAIEQLQITLKDTRIIR